jgi:AcrR family transcriptional regulator
MIEKRKYEQKIRAERHDETRRKITEATVALHQEIGPARTTISAIAERAGVERLTVYRHFPDDGELLNACQDHFLAQHPVPNPALWLATNDPAARLRFALTALYTYYRDTEAMTTNILHDAPLLPTLAANLTGRAVYFDMVREQLAEAWHVGEERRALLTAAVGHALDFEAWRSLVRRQGLSDEQAVDMMASFVSVAATGCLANREEA